MDFSNLSMPSSDTFRAVNIANANRQKVINAAAIQEDSTAENVAYQLYQAIIQYQESLPNTEDVAIMWVQFNESVTILVESIGYIGYTMISFHGKDTKGNPIELIQHISQLNFLLTTASKPEPETPKRRIGFCQE